MGSLGMVTTRARDAETEACVVEQRTAELSRKLQEAESLRDQQVGACAEQFRREVEEFNLQRKTELQNELQQCQVLALQECQVFANRQQLPPPPAPAPQMRA